MKPQMESSSRSRSSNLTLLQAPLVYLCSALAILACGGQQPEEAPVARPVRLLAIGSMAGGGQREFPGRIQAAQNAEVSFEVAGRIIGFPVDEGQEVAQGALLARLDPADFETARDAEVARRQQARADYERYQELYATNAVSLQELEVRRRRYEVAQANLRTAEKAVNDTYLRAPFGGLVARKLVDDFVNVQAKQPILILQDESSLEIVVDVPESVAALAAPGLTLEERRARASGSLVEISAIPGRQFQARLREFSTTADPMTRTFAATLGFENPADVTIRPGMTAKLIVTPRADLADTNVFWIPANAVVADETGTYVWKVDSEAMTVSRAVVEVGELSGSNVQITSGLSNGDMIATTGVHSLREGMAVRRLN